MRTPVTFITLAFFLFATISPLHAFAPAGIHVMTLADLNKVLMSVEQLDALKKQPGVSYTTTAPEITTNQMAVPVPKELGGGFIVSDPESLAAALNATGITATATPASVAGATAAGDASIKIGSAAAGMAATGGFSVGTATLIAVGAAAVIGGTVAAVNAGGDSTTKH